MMATASPTPLPTAGTGFRLHRSHSKYVRRDSPLANSAERPVAAAHRPVQVQRQASEDSDDDLQPPPMLSALGRSVLKQQSDSRASPDAQQRVRYRLVRKDASAHNTPAKDSTTPAPSVRVKRVGLHGAPVRRGKRTPQSEEEHAHNDHAHEQEGHQEQHEQPAQDQENVPVSVPRPKVKMEVELVKEQPGSIMKSQHERVMPIRERVEKAPLAQVSANTPLRPAPPPPPKMSVLEAATKVAGASATRKKSSRRPPFVVNGKSFQPVERCGKGGSAEVWRVQAENGKTFALKRVRLQGQDENAVAGYKGEIDLLNKLKGNPRVVELYDYSVDDDRGILYVLMELGEGDLFKVLNARNGRENAQDPAMSETLVDNTPRVDFCFIRYWWKEMLQCVSAVHRSDIVHSDLKPANFLVVKGSLKLIDFGIAGAIDTDHTVNMHRDNHVGTPNYMSPESLQDNSATANPDGASNVSIGKFMKLGKPSDVWSLGCILYQMVYKDTPFGHIQPAMPKVLAIINPRVPISFPEKTTDGVRVPPELRRTMKKCLQRDPSKRPTVDELLSLDDAFTHPETVPDLRISEDLLEQIIQRVADRFRDTSRPPPTNEEIAQYAPSFYTKIKTWNEQG